MDEKDFAQLESRIKQLEEEVALLKQQQKADDKEFVRANMEERPRAPIVKNKVKPYQKTKPVKKREPTDWEHLIGRVWLPRIFIFVLLIGLIWGFKVAVDYGVLTEPVRIVLGFITAIILYLFGERELKRKHEALGKSLLIGSVGLFILTTFAMNVLYGMIPGVVAFILNIIWVTIGLLLAHRERSEVMAILMAFIGYLIPFLVVGSDQVIGAILYEAIFYAALVYYSINRAFKKLFYIASILLHVIYSIFIVGAWGDSFQLKVMALGALVQHGIIFYAVYGEKFKKLFSIPLLFTSFIVTTIWMKWAMIDQSGQYIAYLIIISLIYTLVVYMKNEAKNQDLVSVALSIATFGVFLLLLQLFKSESNILAVAYLFEGILALYLGYRFHATFQKFTGGFVYVIGTLQIMMIHMSEVISSGTFVWIMFIVSLYGVTYLTKVFYKEKQQVQIAVTFLAIYGHLLLYIRIPDSQFLFSLEYLLALAIITSLGILSVWMKGSYVKEKAIKIIIIGINVLVQLVFLTDVVEVATLSRSENITMMFVSFSWALYASVSVIIGVIYNKKDIRLLGIGLLMITLAKLVLVDLQYVTIIVRAILFIGLGVVGIVLSRLLYMKK